MFKINCLKTDYAYTPIGLENKNPYFSWHINTDDESEFSDHDTCVRVFDESGNILWESEKTNAAKTFVTYSGNSLKTASYYLWDVAVFNKSDIISCSEKTFFMTGMLNNELKGSRWISHYKKTNSCPIFRKCFNADKKIKSAKIISSALGNYDFYIDGKRIGNKLPSGEEYFDELKPGFTEPKMHVHYQTYDVAHLLSENKTHAVSAIVSKGWWSGDIVGNHETHIMNMNRQGEKNAFIMALLLQYSDDSCEIIRTDTSWKTNDNSKICYSDIYDGEIQDLRNSDDWKFPDYDDTSWSYAVLNDEFAGIINSSCMHNVTERKDLEMQGTALNGEFPLNVGANETVIIDFNQNFAGVECITVSGEADTNIIVNHAETLTKTGEPDFSHNRCAKAESTYILKGEKREILKPLLTYYGFQYISITSDKPITIHSASGKVLSAILPAMEKGTIYTDNDNINKLVKNAYWSQTGNFGTVPTDCPQRDERHAFTGDVQIYCKTACYFADVYAYISKWILEDVTYLQHTNGSYPSTAPQSRQVERYGMAGWSDGGIIIPYYLYIMTGNIDILKKHYPSMKKFINWLIENNGPGDHYGDWAIPDCRDNTPELKRFLADAYYCIDIDLFSKICDLLGHKNTYSELYEKLCCNFANKYTDCNGLIDILRNGEGQINQTACVYALYFDLIKDKEIKNKITDQLKQNLSYYNYRLQTGFLGTPYLLDTISKMGLTDEAYRVLTCNEYPSWLYTIEQGANTIWEYWDGEASRNHFAYGSVVGWIFENSAGIKPVCYKNNCTDVLLKPVISKEYGLKTMDAKCEIKNGRICVKWNLTDTEFLYEVEIPSLTKAHLILPFAKNNEWVCTNQNAVLSDNSDALEFILNPGKYSFTIKL